MLSEFDESLPEVEPNPIRAAAPDWSMRLAVDVAIGASVDSILEAYQLQYHQYEEILSDPLFAARVGGIKKELLKNGASFKLKAQLQAEEYLKTSFNMVQDVNTPSTVRAQLIRDTVRWATWDNPVQGAVGGAGGFSININLGGAPRQPVTIDAEPVS